MAQEGRVSGLTSSLFFVLFIIHEGGDVTIREHGLRGRGRSGLGHFCGGDFHRQRGDGGERLEGILMCFPLAGLAFLVPVS